MMRPTRLLLLSILVSVVQVGFLAWTIAGRAAILRDGREIVLKVEPVDPRDLLRGEYVRLAYEISFIPASLIADRPKSGTQIKAGPIFVRLKKAEDGYWHAVGAALGKPAERPAAADEVEIQGAVQGGWPADEVVQIPVDYGIERFYLPEGEGRAIEEDMRVRPFAIKVAVADGGQPQIKALMDGNKLLYQEPLY